MNIRELAGKIMFELQAFEGSRPAIDAPNILIVRGMSRHKVDPESLGLTLDSLLKKINAKKIDMFSEEAGDIIGLMDENLRDNVQIQSDTDIYGIYRLKESFEAMNCHMDYTLGLVNNFGIFIVIWIDKSGIGPQFVELVVSELGN